MDIYDLKKQTFFAGKSSPVTSNPDWLNDDETPFFLNAKGGTLVFLDLKHISIAMEMDVTSYSFRKIVSTWGQSHESKEIRMAESGTLQHNDKVARTNYHQSRQIEPQLFVQNYTKEEKLFPKKIKETIKTQGKKSAVQIKIREDDRKKERMKTLSNEKQLRKKRIRENRKQRIFPKHKSDFMKHLKDYLGFNVEENKTLVKSTKWRNLVVRAVCLAEGNCGENLRELWKCMYKGDLQNGIRDTRLKTKEGNWPVNNITKRKDRNSWITAYLKTSILSTS